MNTDARVTRSGEGFRPLRNLRIPAPGWFVAAIVIALVAATPLLGIASYLTAPEKGVWAHLASTVLGELTTNTALLLLCIVPLTALAGIGLGWLTGACDFPGRKFFQWALVLPFAIPPYVFAFAYLGLLDFSGPVQTALRTIFPSLGFIDIRNVVGVSLILSLAFYPYVYLMSRSAFMTQGRTAIEAARALGHSPSKAFFRVALPMARPFIAAGLVLVCMETLADFGAVSIFNYDTFTTAIYKSWFAMFSLSGAAQLSCVLVAFVLTGLVAEQKLRARMRYTEAGKGSSHQRLKLTGLPMLLALGACSAIFLFAFVIPCIQLALWGWEAFGSDIARYAEYGFNTLRFGMMGTAVTVMAALILIYARHNNPGTIMSWATRLATLGYALPGTVLAVGVFIPAAWLDNAVLGFIERSTGLVIDPFLQGSAGLMIAAYCIRFLAAGFGSMDSAMQRITPSISEAARTMGVTGFKLLRRVHLPMLKKGILTGAILILVDIMKEMPITLMMRPFGGDTLAVKIFEYTSEGEWELAAIPALALVLVGLLPVFLLTRQMEK